MRKKIYSISLILASLLIFTSAFAQKEDNGNSDPAVYNWELAAKGGASLIWGDAGSSYDPFTRWFSNEGAFTGELVLHRRLSNVFGIQIGFAKGVLSGYREEWSSDSHPVASSKTDYFDYHLGLNIDITGIFNRNPNRFFSIYAFGGVGMVNYTATSYLAGNQFKTASGNTLMIPWGGGAKFRISPRFSILLETSFRNTFVDDVDAYVGQGSNVNDIYSITGIGLTYRFGAKKNKNRQIDVVPVVPADTMIAIEDQNINPILADVIVNSGMPVTANRDTTYHIVVMIEKEDLNEFGAYNQRIPKGFSVVEGNSNGGEFSFANQELSIEWKMLPIEQSLEFSYDLVASSLDPKTYTFEGSFVYREDSSLLITTFVDNIQVRLTDAEIMAQNDQNAQVVENPVLVPVSGIDYRVQIAAVFGGKSSPDVMAKRLGLNEEVYEDPYKTGYRYTVGHHDQYGAANSHRKEVPVKGAYVITFVDGKYVGNLEKTNKQVMDQNAVDQSGVTYRIQIAASNGRAYPIAKLAYKYGFNTSDVYEYKNGAWYRYSVNKYSDMASAQAALQDIKGKVKGAYIVKFVNGVAAN